MAGDKGLEPQELGLDPTAQDDRDMERLGKSQQFKVCRDRCGGAQYAG